MFGYPGETLSLVFDILQTVYLLAGVDQGIFHDMLILQSFISKYNKQSITDAMLTSTDFL